MVRFADDPEVRHRIAFLPDYDIGMARYLYWGCDVWLNNPLRPLEACGTSGMKAALNGGAEPVHPRRLVGRVVRRRERLGHPVRRRRRRPRPARRPRGARALRPDREAGARRASTTGDGDGVPARWVEMVRHTLHDARARRCWPPGWCATTCSSSTRRPPARRGRWPPTGYAPAAQLAAGARGAGAWPACGCGTSRPPAWATTPELGGDDRRCGRGGAAGADARRRRRPGRVRPGGRHRRAAPT